MDVEAVVQKFKIDLLKKMPFYGDIITRLTFEADHSVSTAQTDGRTIQYNPLFLANLGNIGQVNFVLLHEVFHVLLLHTTRIGDREPKVWNVACDLVVNSMLNRLSRDMRLANIPFEMPEKALFSTLNGTETVEEIYGQQMAVNSPSSLKKAMQVTVVFTKGWGDPTVETVPSPKDLVLSAESGGQASADGRAADGSGGPEGAAATEAYVQGIIREALQKNRGTGSSIYIPDELYSLRESKNLHWRKLLKNFLSEQISDDTSYATPERKYLHMDLLLPGHGLGEAEVEEIWAFVDSSGSVGKAEMEQFLTQLYRVVKEFKCTLHLCYWDTAVTDVYRNIRQERDVLKSIPHHSGGTDINCVYDWLRVNKVKPDVLLILTDGYFGLIRRENISRQLTRKTILVLSTPALVEDNDIRQLGKVTGL